MSKFYGSMVNEKGGKAVTKAGNREIVAHVRGWDAGVQVEAFIDDAGRDAFRVRMTHGSNGKGQPIVVGVVVNTGNGPQFGMPSREPSNPPGACI